jgi:flagellar L-ring protein FlgH
MRLFLTAALFAATLCGCAHQQQPALTDSSWLAELPPTQPAHSQTRDGSLWMEGGTTSALFADRRAALPGDVLTVTVVEEAKAKKTASTSTKRSSSTDANVNALLGLVSSVTAANPDMGTTLGVGAGTDNSFDGEGSTLREGTLETTLTVRVMQVLPNGHLVISGTRTLKVNNEVQVLAMRGVVDPRDIAVDNSVLSTKVADAQIEFFGQGVIGDKQHPGWLQRGMDWIWPF